MSLRTLYDEASLWMTPGGYEDGKLFSELPTDGSGDFTFSRGSNLAATRVGPTGLIEKGRENLALYSNTFSSWNAASGGSVTSGQLGYDGTNDAWLLTSGSSTYSRIERTIAHTGVYTISVYAKAGTLNWLSFENSGITSDETYFDLVNGTTGTDGSNVVHSSIESVGDGWYRCSATFNGTSNVQRIYPAVRNGDLNSAQGNIYIQDFQFEAGLVATDYIETGASTAQAGILEDMPRLDYSGSCPALLLEPQRTNLVVQSEDVSNWWLLSNVTATNNQGISPEGVNNAAKITINSTGGAVIYRTGVNVGDGVLSFFAKPETLSNGRIRVSVDGVGAAYWNIDGTLNSVTGGTAENAENYGNGWYRYSYNVPSGNVINYGVQGGVIGEHLLIYGMQAEAGSYPTSYIPTYGSSVTRLKDTASLVGTDLLDQDNQTLFIEYTKGGIDGSANTIFSTSDGTSSANRMQIVDNNDDVYLYSNAGGTNILNNTNALLLANLETGDTIKVAVVMTATSIKAFANGVAKVNFTDSFSWSVTMDDLYMGARGGSSEPPKGQGVKQAVLFPTALTDSECIKLTTI